MVRQPLIAARNRAGGAGRGDGAVPGHAHVHHLGLAEDRYEGRWAAACAGVATSKGNIRRARFH